MRISAPLGMRSVLLTLLAAVALNAAAEFPDAQPPGTPTANTAEKLLAQLDHPDFAVRTAAARQLNNLPGDALPVLEAAIRDGTLSAESQIRIQTAMKFIKPRNFFEAREHRRNDWERQTLRDAYHQSGQTDPAYDKAVDDAIDAFRGLRYEPQMNDRDPVRARVVAALKGAIEKGCENPYVEMLCCAAAARDGLRNLPPKLRFPERLFDAFLEGKYHPAVKLIIIHRFLPCITFSKRNMMKRLPDLVDEMCADPKVPDTESFIILSSLATGFASHSYKPYYFDPVAAEYLKRRPYQLDAMALKGFNEFLIASRERGPSDHPSPAALQAYKNWLDTAEKTLQAAWEFDKTEPVVPALMISVKHAQGTADHEVIDQWFKRAVELNPDNGDAYTAKLRYLRSFGSHDESIAFGRECLATQNWRAGVPFVLSIQHEWYAAGDSVNYFAVAENWTDMEDVYEGAFLSFPNDVEHRNHFVFVALVARKYDVASRHIAILGDKSKWYYDPKNHSWGDAELRRNPPATLTTRPTTRAATTRRTPRPAATRPTK